MYKHRTHGFIKREFLGVLYRNLSLQDSGSYRCGETGGWSHDVELKVKRDPCCSGPSAVTGFLGETLTINCSYPEEFKGHIKYLHKQDGQYFTELIRTTETQRNRFSISEDRSSKVVSVRISDVREEDRGVYYCGVWIGLWLEETLFINCAPLFSEIQLKITAPASSTFIIIINSVCVTLLLIGGSALIYKLRFRKTQDSASISCPSGTKESTTGDYINDRPGNNMRMNPIHYNNKNETDSIYEIIDPNNIASDAIDQSLGPNTNQSDSVYQSLTPNTNQSDSVYQSLNLNTNQSDLGFPKTSQNKEDS
ncbi:uncharacterized protein [Hoplias malabaricus]|uniref:uncharacterized protein n=1 Tax=Hoplias malabaricus TaxID=27720 RepID=UPI00346224C8